MCKKCLEAVNRHYPDLKGKQIGELLMGATCYPFGTTEQIENDLIELKEKTDGTLHDALMYACEQTEQEMDKFHEKEKNES